MKRLIVLLLMTLPLLLRAQTGIHFQTSLSWEQVKAKAKAENKYIFMDVFATWCGPCKMMDEQVYPNDEVGKLMNEKFICVRLQMDQTSNDSEETKSWYPVADQVSKTYHIDGYPSFLFISPDGQLAYKDVGFMNVKDFTKLANKALDPQSLQYYNDFEAYKNGEKDYPKMGELALFVLNIVGDKGEARKIATDYKENYIDHLPDSQIANKAVFIFFETYGSLIKPNDRYFKLCYNEPDKIDSLTESGWSNQLITGIIIDQIDHQLLKDGKPLIKNPNWAKIDDTIHRQFPKIDLWPSIVNYRINYYALLGDWRNWFTYKDQQIRTEKHAPGWVYIELNVYGAWHAFRFCNDPVVLTKALKWINMAIDSCNDSQEHILFQYLDTKAQLLYKTGKVKEAIQIENQALQKAQEAADERVRLHQPGKIDVQSYITIIAQMKAHEPTYQSEHAVWDAASLTRIKQATN